MSNQRDKVEKLMEEMFSSESEEGTSSSEYLPSDDDNRSDTSSGILQTLQGDEVSTNEPQNTTQQQNEVSQHVTDWPVQNIRNRGRKRVRNEQNWKKNENKTKRAHGQEYMTKKGNTVHSKQVDTAPCGCNKNCNMRIDQERQKQIFEEYYGLGNYNLQSSFLYSMVKVVNKERTYTQSHTSKREKSRFYHMIGRQGNEVKVCKTFFQKTLQVSAGRLDRVLKQKGNESVPPVDKRGRAPSANKTSNDRVKEVKTFIGSFPAYESHYALHKSHNKKYLAPDLSLNKMYNLYYESNDNQVSKHIFRNIFNKDFNLSFHAPLSDTCRKCDSFNIKILATDVEEEKNIISTERELHLRKAESARSGMKMDSTNAKADSNITAIAFDLMKTLPTPVLATGVCYYKRQLWTYCFGIHNLGTDDVTMFVWNESIASRGPQEIGSCILYYIKHFVTNKKLIMYSDQCGGQNRNVKLSVLCQHIVSNPDYTVNAIDHKFLVSGHSYLPCDQDFGLVEKQKKFFKDIFTPDHWINVIKASRKKNPFKVITMKKENFFSTKKLEGNIVNRKVANDGSKVEWLKIQWLRFVKHDPFTIQYKYSNNIEVPFYSVNLKKRITTAITTLDVLYPRGNLITEAKKKDLIALLDFVPPVHHNFYINLKVNNNTNDFVDPVSGDSEDE